jgi:hypothetical protein
VTEFGLLLTTCVQAIYEYVTHGKGILGSQGNYNLQHRKMCAPPFKNAHQLRKFTNTIADKVSAAPTSSSAPGRHRGIVTTFLLMAAVMSFKTFFLCTVCLQETLCG